MHFKLSARELEILDDREVILSRLRDSQNKRVKSLKPPILVVPTDKSRLVSVIERDESFAEMLKAAEEEDEADSLEEEERRKVRKKSN